MTILWQDLRFAGRGLKKSPGFTAVAVLTLALGIGANLALFGILNEMLLRPRAVARPDELWAVVPVNEGGQRVHTPPCRQYYEAIRERARFFKGVVGYAGIEPKMRADEGLERVGAELVTPGYFPFLGVRAARGRVFGPEEDAETGGHAVAVISDAFWRRRFGGAPDAVAALVAYAWVGRGIMSLADWWSGPALRLVPDVRVLVCAAGVALAVGVGSSLVPALQATRFAPAAALKGSQGAGRQRLWLRHGLIVGQVAGSLILLCGAMLCLRSMSKQLAVDVGYRHDRLAIAKLDLEGIGFTEETFEPQLAQVIRQVALVPEVEQVGVSGRQPLGGGVGSMDTASFTPEGYVSLDGGSVDVAFCGGVGPGMFAVMGLLMLRGREFRPEDVESGPMVLVVNESFAQRFWPGQDPVGKHIHKWPVIGVVKDACIHQYAERPGPAVFRCAKKAELLHATLLIRTKGDARRVVASVRSELARIHPKLVHNDVRPLRDVIKDALAFQQAALRILGVLGVLALVLASVGTYGVMAYVVSSRTREVGIRLAVGATRANVMRLILLAGLRLGLIAVAIALPLALAAAGLLRHQITGISPFDPVSFIVVAASVLAALSAACWLPARRAARIDPMAALRYE